MTYKNIPFVAGCCLFFLAACQSPKDQIARKWQVDSFENPSDDSMMKVQEHAIDTMTVVDSNIAMYLGTSNVDSVKAIAKKQMSDFKQQRLDAVRQNSMQFQKGGVVIYQSGNGMSDSGKWEMPNDKQLILSSSEKQAGAAQQSDTFAIEKISASDLRLKRQQGTNVMYINLKAAEGKEGEKKAEEKK